MPAWMTPLEWPVWWRPSRGSDSSTQSRAPGASRPAPWRRRVRECLPRRPPGRTRTEVWLPLSTFGEAADAMRRSSEAPGYGAGRTSMSARSKRSAVGAVSLIVTAVPAAGVGGSGAAPSRCRRWGSRNWSTSVWLGPTVRAIALSQSLADAPDPAFRRAVVTATPGRAARGAVAAPSAPSAAVSAPVNAATVDRALRAAGGARRGDRDVRERGRARRPARSRPCRPARWRAGAAST